MTATLTAKSRTATETEQADPMEDVIFITEAGLEALRTAPVVPDEDNGGADADEEEPGESEAVAFTPDTREKADWVLGKIADARTRAARIRENAERMAREAEREAEGLEWRYGAALMDLARRETAGGKKKSLTLYHGVLGFRTKPGSVSVTDEAAALAWATENLPDAITRRVDKKALGDALRGSGEVVEFAQFTPAEEVFYIR